MSVHKQSVSFTDTAFSYAKDLVDQGVYPNVSAAVSGELARARMSRERDQALFEVELKRRLDLPLDQWVPVGSVDEIFEGAYARIEQLEAGAGEAKG